MICLKTGMMNEYQVATKYAVTGTLILTGIKTVADLDCEVLPECEAIMSFGMCGGLRPKLPIVGQTVIATRLIGPNGEAYECDLAWRRKLFAITNYYAQPYYSSGLFNQANTPAQRAALYAQTNAWCIDDESLWVAQFAAKRNIPFAIMRNVSDAWNDDVSITSNILNASGGIDPMAVLKAVVTEPVNMVKIGIHYEISQRALEAAAQKVGPSFGW